MSEPGEGVPQAQKPDSPETAALKERREALHNEVVERFSFMHPDRTPFSRKEVEETISAARLEAGEILVTAVGAEADSLIFNDKLPTSTVATIAERERAAMLLVASMKAEYDLNKQSRNTEVSDKIHRLFDKIAPLTRTLSIKKASSLSGDSDSLGQRMAGHITGTVPDESFEAVLGKNFADYLKKSSEVATEPIRKNLAAEYRAKNE